jgi:glycogen(starch) synthase
LDGKIDNTHIEDINVLSLPFKSTYLKGDLKEFHSLIKIASELRKNFHPDIVHIQLNHLLAWFELLTRTNFSIKTLVTVHPPIEMTNIPDQMLKRILSSNDTVVAVSKAQKRDILNYLGLEAKVECIYNGIPDYQRNASLIKFNPAQILCLGRLHVTKGFHYALEACSKVLRNLPGSIKVVVAGDGPELKNLKELGSELGFTNSDLEFRGWVNNEAVPELLNESSIVLMPSTWNEPFGLVAVQAAQMGRPIIASNIGGIAEIVLHHKTGILVEPGNSDEIANAILLLLSNPSFAESLGNAAKKRAALNFSVNRCAADYECLYSSLIN